MPPKQFLFGKHLFFVLFSSNSGNAGASVSLNTTTSVFTLQPGTYLIRASAPAFRVNNHQIRLASVAGTVYTEVGRGSWEWTDAVSTSATESRSTLSVYLTVAAATDYVLQHICARSQVIPLHIYTN